MSTIAILTSLKEYQRHVCRPPAAGPTVSRFKQPRHITLSIVEHAQGRASELPVRLKKRSGSDQAVIRRKIPK